MTEPVLVEEQIIQAARCEFGNKLARVYNECRDLAACTCAPSSDEHSPHSSICPKRIWNQAARMAVQMGLQT